MAQNWAQVEQFAILSAIISNFFSGRDILVDNLFSKCVVYVVGTSLYCS